MDIYCRKCGEPWDTYSLHDEAEESGRPYSAVKEDFMRNGCSALFGARCSSNEARPEIAMAYELLGDDLDGAASILEDYL